VKPTSDVTGLYRAFPAYLWVEDEETRTYLDTVWNGESRIKIYVAGGHSHLPALVKAAHSDYSTHVFGFRDRDFGASNRAHWNDPALDVLTSDVLELENLLLDAEAIAACDVNTSGLGAADIELEMRRLATPLTWWMACRKTITALRDAVMTDFLSHPSRTRVRTRQEAEDAIVTSAWWSTVLPALHGTWGSSASITQRLVQDESDFSAMLGTDAWKRDFSGKEIVQDLIAKVWTRKRPGDPAGRLEFVRAIAESQLRMGRVPAEIVELRTAIRRRIGL